MWKFSEYFNVKDQYQSLFSGVVRYSSIHPLSFKPFNAVYQGTVYLGCSMISNGKLSVNAVLTTRSSCSTASFMVLLQFHQTHHTSSLLVTPPEATLSDSDNSIVESNPTSILTSQASFACGTHYQTPSCQLQPWNPSGADWVHYLFVKLWAVFACTSVFFMFCTSVYLRFCVPA